MNTHQEICQFISEQSYFIELLKAVEHLGLPDCWIAAGIIRNAVWDRLHGYEIASPDTTDVDVVYFDATNLSAARDKDIEKNLRGKFSPISWEVKNQARMHRQNGDQPYQSTEDAMRHWPETATAIAARLTNNRIELLAPFGIDDLVSLKVRPTPTFALKQNVLQTRAASKGWAKRWPNLKFLLN